MNATQAADLTDFLAICAMVLVGTFFLGFGVMQAGDAVTLAVFAAMGLLMIGGGIASLLALETA